MDINIFNFELPEELIAQYPLSHRDECKLLSINKKEKTYKDETFKDIVKYFKKGDVLVRIWNKIRN